MIRPKQNSNHHHDLTFFRRYPALNLHPSYCYVEKTYASQRYQRFDSIAKIGDLKISSRKKKRMWWFVNFCSPLIRALLGLMWALFLGGCGIYPLEFPWLHPQLRPAKSTSSTSSNRGWKKPRRRDGWSRHVGGSRLPRCTMSECHMRALELVHSLELFGGSSQLVSG